MKKHKGLNLLETIATIFIILFLLAILFPARDKPKHISKRVVCGTNLRGLGTAHVVYANDYDDEYPVLGKGRWSKKLGYSYEDSKFDAHNYEGDCTITSSLYMLVREADVSPRSFICPKSNQIEFDGQNSKNLDIVELWDFGKNPYPHVSYAYHNPYGKFPPNGALSAAFAIMADMSPWMEEGDFLPENSDKNLPPQIIDHLNPITFDKGNSLTHNVYIKNFILFDERTKILDAGESQNVLFADGHAANEKAPNIGVKYDNIYTYWSTDENPTDQDKQGGTAPTSRSAENDAKGVNDSFLVL
jgi:hypothetical protein